MTCIGVGVGIGFGGGVTSFDFAASVMAIAGGPSSFLRVTQEEDEGGLADLSGNGNGATTDGDDATFTASGGPGGKPGLVFNGTSNRYNFANPSITSNSITLMAALIQGAGALDQSFLGTQSSGRAFLLRRTGNVAIYDSAFKTFGALSTGAQILTWQIDAVGGTCEMFRNGVSLGADTYDGTFWPFNSGSKLGALAGPTWYADMIFSSMALWESALTTEQLAAAHAAFATEYG